MVVSFATSKVVEYVRITNYYVYLKFLVVILTSNIQRYENNRDAL